MSMILQLGHIGSPLEEALSISISPVCASTERTSTDKRRTVDNLQSERDPLPADFTDPPIPADPPEGSHRSSIPARCRCVNGLTLCV
jgi:hypothetical protein